ncbi:MAG: hypothetical protein ABIE70_09290 [bacterium]
MSGIEILQIWLIAFLTLALFSFTFKDNPFYKVAEHIFAGLTAGYQVGLIWDTVVIQKLWDPMLGGSWWLFLPGILGLLMFSRFTKNYSWLSRISLAFVMGTTSGVFLTTNLHGWVLPQMKAAMLPLGGGGGFAAALLAIIVVLGIVSTLIYFYFSTEHKGVVGITAKMGIWFIMMAFGAHFGYTVMGRVSLLIGRVQFLAGDWVGSFSQIF